LEHHTRFGLLRHETMTFLLSFLENRGPKTQEFFIFSLSCRISKRLTVFPSKRMQLRSLCGATADEKAKVLGGSLVIGPAAGCSSRCRSEVVPHVLERTPLRLVGLALVR
jgi:hypothetical protein